jgi:hypothetical protein
MALPPGITTRVYSGTITGLDGANASGHLEFRLPQPLFDAAHNVVVGPDKNITATVSSGAFTANLPCAPWLYIVRVDTDVLQDVYLLSVPQGTDPLRFADTYKTAGTPAQVDFFALLQHIHATGDVTGLDALLSTLSSRVTELESRPVGGVTDHGQLTGLADDDHPQYLDSSRLASALTAYLPRSGGTITGPISWSGTPTAGTHLATKSYVDSRGGAQASLPLFDVEHYGAVGDGVTDDYPAIRAAWDAMLASSVDGALFFPRAVAYRIDASTVGRLALTSDKARALFPLPMRSRQVVKLTYGILGVGDPYSVRTADLGSTPGQVATASVLHVDYGTPFAWSSSAGLPCVIGAPDADMTDNSGNTFSNIHFTVDNLIIRQPTNPSLCALNLEQVSTVHIGSLRVDVDAVLDEVPEPTHPTGAALLLPRSNNNVAVSVDRLVVEGHYAGVPITEHVELRTAIALRCKVAVHTRRPCSHYGLVQHLKVEQCPWGISGWDPQSGVVGVHGWTGRFGFLDIEDYAYLGAQPWLYAPTAGAHVNDPNGALQGTIAFCGRINSEPPSPSGIGIGPGGGSASLYVIGPSGTNSPMAIYGFDQGAAATRLSPPTGPVVTTHRLFDGIDGPGSSVTDNSPINLGVRIDVTDPCKAKGIRFWRSDTAITGAITGRLWRISDQSAMPGADVTFTLSGTGWQSADFPSPVDLAPGERYAVIVHFPDRFSSTGSYWDSGPGGGGIVSGPIRAYSTNDSAGGQGVYGYGPLTTYPGGNGSGTNYWVDITVTTT